MRIDRFRREEGGEELTRAPNPFFRFDLNHDGTRRAVRKETRVGYRGGRRGIGEFIETNIYPRGFGSGECDRLD